MIIADNVPAWKLKTGLKNKAGFAIRSPQIG
jgi:hypothetical protein